MDGDAEKIDRSIDFLNQNHDSEAELGEALLSYIADARDFAEVAANGLPVIAGERTYPDEENPEIWRDIILFGEADWGIRVEWDGKGEAEITGESQEFYGDGRKFLAFLSERHPDIVKEFASQDDEYSDIVAEFDEATDDGGAPEASLLDMMAKEGLDRPKHPTATAQPAAAPTSAQTAQAFTPEPAAAPMRPPQPAPAAVASNRFRQSVQREPETRQETSRPGFLRRLKGIFGRG